MPLRPTRAAIALALTGCLGNAPARPPDPGPTADGGRDRPAIRSWTVRDFSGRVHPADRAPRRPVIVIESTVPLLGDPEPLALLASPPNEALRDDLERAPLRASTEALRVEATVERRGTALLLRPRGALEPGGTYTVALGAWAHDASGRSLDEPLAGALVVADGPDAGAAMTDTWPADGTAGVPATLPLVAVRFDGYVDGTDAIGLGDDAGGEVPVRRQAVPCDLIGWRDGRCVVLRPAAALARGAAYRIVVGEDVRDATGAPVGPVTAMFRTASGGRATDLGWLSPTCALDEESVAVGCLLADDRSLTLRVRADAPVRLWLVSAHATDSAVAPRGEATLRLAGLSPGTPQDVTLRAVDLSGREQSVTSTWSTEADLAPLSITEVRADPRGPEPAQEYVEVANVGHAPVDLSGFTLADRADREGDRVSDAVLVPPGARVLLVADAFDPTHPEDASVPPGVGLVRLGTSLGSGGLANGGEPLFLRDPEGRRVSAAPAVKPPEAGTCIVRIAADPRTGDAAAFAPAPCTPGRP